MARPLRIEFPGAVYHITARGNEKKHIFLSTQDRKLFLDILQSVIKTYHWFCHSYCLMGNHYHLLIETPEGNLSSGMRQLNGVFTQQINQIHHRVGHLFQGRFEAILIQKEPHLLEVARYIVLNPVRAHIVENPKDWRWSSYRAVAGYSHVPAYLTVDWILKQFDTHRKTAQKEYRIFVLDGMATKSTFEQMGKEKILGSLEFVHSVWQTKPDCDLILEVPKAERMIGRPDLKIIFEDIKSQKERDELIKFARIRCGYSIKSIAEQIGLHYSTVSKILSQNSRFKT